jgi:hypothetical protein
MAKLVRQINELYLRELKIRKDFSKLEHDLQQSYRERVSESGSFQEYLTQLRELNTERTTQISEVYSNISSFNETLAFLKRESDARDMYDKLVWGNIAQSLSNLQNSLCFNNLVMVDETAELETLL